MTILAQLANIYRPMDVMSSLFASPDGH